MSGWEITPEGACKGDECVPLPGIDATADGTFDVRTRSPERMGMPVVSDEQHGAYDQWAHDRPNTCSTRRAARQIELHDFAGNAFDVASPAGQEGLLLAWASW